MRQFTFKRTVLAWYNIRIAGQDEVIATLPLDAMKKLVKGFTGSSIGCFEASINELMEVAK